jgi:hypothetical protein
MGSGVTAAWSAVTAPARRLEVAEIVPGVARHRQVFAPHNEVADYDLHLGDGRSRLTASNGDLELIVTDIIFPEDAGAGGLFSVEYFQLAHDRLAEGGLFMHWLPLWQLSSDSFRSVVAAFLSVFPEATLWAVCANSSRPLAGLAGIDGSSGDTFSFDRIADRLHAGPTDRLGSEVGIADAAAVLSRFVAGAERLRTLAGDAKPCTDDMPVGELESRSSAENRWARENLKIVVGVWEPPISCRRLSAGWTEDQARRVSELAAARLVLAEACLMMGSEQPPSPQSVLVKLRSARRASPGDPEIAYELWNGLVQVGLEWTHDGTFEGLSMGRRLLEEALTVGPERDFIMRDLAIAMSVAGQRREALGKARRACELSPDEPVNWEVLIQVARSAGENAEADKAAEVLNRIRVQQPNGADGS